MVGEMKVNIRLFCGLVCLLGAEFSVAAEGNLWGVRVERTMVTADGRWGGCMAQLDQQIATAGVDCPGDWVTFSCSGEFVSKDLAYRMFDSAQMAHALNSQLRVFVSDAQKHNGYCFSNRVDAIR